MKGGRLRIIPDCLQLRMNREQIDGDRRGLGGLVEKVEGIKK